MREYALKAKLIKDNAWVKGSYFCNEDKHYLITSISPLTIEEIDFNTLSAPAQFREVSVEERIFKEHIYENDIIEFYFDRLCDYSPQSKYDGKVLVRGVVKYNKYNGSFYIETNNYYNIKIFKARGKEKYDRFLPSTVSLSYNFAYFHSNENDLNNEIVFKSKRPQIYKYHNVKIIGNIFDNEYLLKEEPTL